MAILAAKKIPWQIWILSGVIALFAVSNWWSFREGKASTQAQWDQAVERGRVLVKKLESQQHVVTEKVETIYVDRWRTIYEKGSVIEREVPVYIPADECSLSGSFRVLHDAAATNSIPRASEVPDAESVPARDLARTVGRNYTTCHAAINDLEGLRVWAIQQQELYLELCKQPGVRCN